MTPSKADLCEASGIMREVEKDLAAVRPQYARVEHPRACGMLNPWAIHPRLHRRASLTHADNSLWVGTRRTRSVTRTK